MRYPALHAAVAEAQGRNASLSTVEVRPSPLSGTRRIVDVVFSFADRATDVVEKRFVIIVIDASVSVKWVVREIGSEAADALLDDRDLIAPAFWLAEAGNALWRRQRIGKISADEVDVRLAALLTAPFTSQPLEPILQTALKLAVEIGYPVYDCLYLALALQRQTHVVTADHRFVSAANLPHLAGTIRLLDA